MTKNRPSGVKWAGNALQELERVMQLRSLSLVRRESLFRSRLCAWWMR